MPGTPDQWFRDPAKENKSGRVNYSGYFVTSTNGALVAASTDAPGFTLTRTGAGRYTLQLVNAKGEAVVVSPTPNLKQTPGLRGFKATVIPTAGITAARAFHAYIRAGLATLFSAGNFIVQFADGAATPADADVPDGAAFLIEFSISRSSAVP
jgi:hypothetical protein